MDRTSLSTPTKEMIALVRRILLSILIIASVWAIIWGLKGGPTIGSTPIVPPPTTTYQSPSNESATTPAPTATRQDHSTATARPTEPASADSSEPTGPPVDQASKTTAQAPSPAPDATPQPSAEVISDVAGVPIHVGVRRGDLVLAGADIVPVQMDHLQSINPPSGMVGWYGPPEWSTTPGDWSSHPGILAGHSTYNGVADVFDRLGEVKAGDIVTVTYGTGGQVTDVAEFVVDSGALSVPKNDVVDLADSVYRWVWQLGEPGRKISIFTCDPAEGRSLAGESHNNWVIQATRIN